MNTEENIRVQDKNDLASVYKHYSGSHKKSQSSNRVNTEDGAS